VSTHGDAGPIRKLLLGVLSHASTTKQPLMLNPSSPQHKKPKVEDIKPHDAEWSRVERRKSQKARNASQTRHLPPGSMIEVRLPYSRAHISTLAQNAPSTKVVTLLVPGILPDCLALPPPPTSATASPHILLQKPRSRSRVHV
jgi:hypothetical protein